MLPFLVVGNDEVAITGLLVCGPNWLMVNHNQAVDDGPDLAPVPAGQLDQLTNQVGMVNTMWQQP